jgi:hypothetical protein
MINTFTRPQPPAGYYTIGINQSKILDLLVLLAPHFPAKKAWNGRRRVLGPYKTVVLTLTYLRRNRVQHELAEDYGVSQATISRAITFMTAL